MQARREQIAALGASVVFVAFDDAEQLRSKLLAGIDLVVPLGIDRDRDAYRRWGLRRAPAWRIWLDPAVWKQYWKLVGSGERLRGSGEDTLQLGGDFVVAPDRTIAYARPQTRDDRPPIGKLLSVVSGLASSP